MSKLMSHREMKAASRVVGNLEGRLRLMENIVTKLLERENLSLGITKDGTFQLIPTPPPAPEQELEMTIVEEAPV